MGAIAQRRVARAVRPGGPEVIELGVEDIAPLKCGEVLVRVEAAGLNHAETLIRSGRYAVRLPFPYAVGGEGSGTVVAAAPDVTIPPGTRVCWAAVLGSCANLVVAPASMLVRLPDELSFGDGASSPSPGSPPEVWPGSGRWKEAQPWFWGAAGAVGRMLVAILADRGVKVISIASGKRVDAALAAGASSVIDRATEDVQEVVRVRTGRARCGRRL
jgi:NADPH:quinone reductase